MATESAKYLSTLHKQIDQYFSFSEVRELCFELGVDHENIPGDHRSAFIRNLIVSLAKQNRLQELINHVRQERPHVDWQNVPADFQLPESVAQEDIRQVINYNVYQGDIDQSVTFNQQNQTVHGSQVNTSGEAHIGQIGSNIDTGGGEFVQGNKTSVGNVQNAQNAEGIVIGDEASANVSKQAAQLNSAERPSTFPTASHPTIQQTIDRVNIYLQMVSPERNEAASELVNGMKLIIRLAEQGPSDPLHLKLLCLGQLQLAQELTADVPGIEQVMAQFVTAVQQQHA
ncbi:MAG: hypothetical protein CL608_23310 [Anaerolineaceae bacterium]|nr:hypothetical protein [Anaerolineaceae bacterium]